jgi:hypothetical protein
MVDGEVRILYCGRGEELDDSFIEFMKSLGYEVWAKGYPMGDRELCFLPRPEEMDESCEHCGARHDPLTCPDHR